MRTLLSGFLLAFASLTCCAEEFDYWIGTGKSDITGPASGLQMWGFAREGQNTEGIHIRLWARAFIVVEAEGDERLAIVVSDLGSIPHDIKQAVISRLSARYGEIYNPANTLISATHTHAGPGGYWPATEASALAGAFYRDHFDAIVDGIVAALIHAHENLAPGNIYINEGIVENAGAQRSRTAYENNPEKERARYDSDTDKQMVLLKFVTAEGVTGILNWFAVHPTSMTYNNRLISGDHKGHAEQLFEASATGETYTDNFIAAFANSNCGDVTANLNLDNTGPGSDDFDTTRIIAERQFNAAAKLADTATTRLTGPIRSVHSYVDFSDLAVSDKFTDAGEQHTCPSAYGYSFAAGSTEDGGGHPLFREGMTEQLPEIEAAIKQQLNLPEPGEAIRNCQLPKPLLMAPGDFDPPAQAQTIPLAITRIGPLTLVAVPGEVTTMAGRRLRDTVAEGLPDASPVVIAAYANQYAGYVTTREEYLTQQYEGGHTLFGPWMLAGMQQEFARLATAIAAGESAAPGPKPRSFLASAPDAGLGSTPDRVPEGIRFGDIVSHVEPRYVPGDTAQAVFWSANPNNGFEAGQSLVVVQRMVSDGWQDVASDDAWETRYRWRPVDDQPGVSQAVLQWDIP
ncbi:MAG: neutral/alkaline non-lysosomal ceramidase N-terminal domain-containing protein, partial [Pseudomonadales bacterium]|nr:neutral/alkaline non-lysosomal ceramidase N-terminal domain-containing protein [Pseudomonadales bacterium]